MQANLEYNNYSSNLDRAIIPMTTLTHDLQLSSVTNSLPDGTIEKKFNLAVVDKATNDTIDISLSSDEARQFIALISVFLKQIG